MKTHPDKDKGKIQICQVLPALQSGGVERGAVDIARAIKEAGLGSHVVSEGGRLVAQLEREGSLHHLMPVASKNPWRILRNVFLLKSLCEREKINLLHVRSRAPGWSVYWVANLMKIPLIATYHGAYNGRKGLKKFYNSIMTRADVIIAPSVSIQKHILQVHGEHLAPKIRVIHRGVDLQVFSKDATTEERASRLRRAWGIPQEAVLVLVPGRLTRWKGHEDVMISVDRFLKSSRLKSPLHVVFLGEVGKNERYVLELKTKIKEKGLESFFHFFPHEADMAAAYLASDVVMAPSREPEAFGRVFAEAGAMGRLVISTNHGGAQEIVLPGQTGWLVEPCQPAQLEEALAEFLALSSKDRSERELFAQEYVAQNFSLFSMQEKTLKVYGDFI